MYTLQKLTEELSKSKTLFEKIKLFLDANAARLLVNSITLEDLDNFLNSLARQDNELFTFIKSNTVFFLLYLCTFDDVKEYTINEAIHTLKNIISTLQLHVNKTEGSIETGLLSNTTILRDGTLYLEQVSTETLSTNIPNLPDSCKSFTVFEQVHHLLYNVVLTSLPIDGFNIPTSTNIYHTWFLTSYEDSIISEHDIDLKLMADKTISSYRHLFISPNNLTQSHKIARLRTQEIYTHLNISSPSQTDLPLISFDVNDLIHIPPRSQLIFAHIIESILLNTIPSNEITSIEKFIMESYETIMSILSQIRHIASSDSILTIKLVSIKQILMSHGLSYARTEEYDSLMRMSSHKQIQGLYGDSLKEFHSLLENLVTFCLDFYTCLLNISPTSISHRQLSYSIVPDHKHARSPTLSLSSNIFSFIFPKPPTNILNTIYGDILSSIMRSMYVSWVNRHWGIEIQDTCILPVDIGPQKDVSPETVVRFCKQLAIGTLDYDKDIVQHRSFYQNFIKFVIAPTLKGIFSKMFTRNRAMFQLRWLLIFAIEDAAILQPIRRPIAMLYFEIQDILHGNNSSVSFYNILDHVASIEKIIVQHDQDFTVPTDFLLDLLMLDTAAPYYHAYESVTGITTRVELLVKEIIPKVKVANTLCNTVHIYDQTSNSFSIHRLQGHTLTFHINTFKDVLQDLGSNFDKFTETLQDSEYELQEELKTVRSYIAQLIKCKNHSIKISIDIDVWNQLKNTFLGLLSKISNISFMLSKCCINHLKQKFHMMFSEDIISPALLYQITQDSSNEDTLAKIVDSHLLIESTDLEINETKLPITVSDDDIKLIQATYPEITEKNKMYETQSMSHKRVPYTNSYDTPTLDINWTTVASTDHVVTKLDCPFTIVNLQDLLSMLT